MILLLRGDHRQRLRQRSRRNRLMLAAMVVLIAGAGGLWMIIGLSAGQPASLAELATEETLPESHLHLRFRAALPASSDLHEYKLKAGMEALVAGDYPLAVETLTDLQNEHAESDEAAMYLGVALYLSGDDSDRTRALLARGVSAMHGLTRRTAIWYLANSCLRSGDVDAAILLLQSPDLHEYDTRYGRYSEELLQRLLDARAG
jgi:hypothetical protein